MTDINRRTYTVITPPVEEPVTVRDFKQYARIDDDVDDSFIMLYLKAARKQAEEYIGKKLITQTVKCRLDYFPEENNQKRGLRNIGYYTPHDIKPRGFYWPSDDYIDLAYGPIQSITSVTTYDQSNASTVMSSSSYFLDAAGSRLVLNSGVTWNVNLRQRASIEIVTVNGYGDEAEFVPEDIILGIQALAKQAYECRMPGGGGSETLGMLDAYRDLSKRGL